MDAREKIVNFPTVHEPVKSSCCSYVCTRLGREFHASFFSFHVANLCDMMEVGTIGVLFLTGALRLT